MDASRACIAFHGADFVEYEQEGINREITDRVSYDVPALPLEQSAETLAEVLDKENYYCGAIIANFAYLWRGFQLDQGFSHYDDSRGVHIPMRPVFDMRRSPALHQRFRHKLLNYANAEDVTTRCIDWLRDNHQSSFFLFVNYMDTHTPYAPPPEYRNLFSSDRSDSAPLTRKAEVSVMEGKEGLPQEMRASMIALYDAELRYVDAEIGRLMDWLKSKNLYERSLIVIMSDHGESFGPI